MGLNSTPSGERIHIGFFGCTNSGKSSLVNAVTGQNLAVVSDVKGTTTDPVSKAMELLPLGPVMIIDTPGLDDKSTLGQKRIEKTMQILSKTDIGVLVVDASLGKTQFDRDIENQLKAKNIPYLVVFNKCELVDADKLSALLENEENALFASALTGQNINELKGKIGTLAKDFKNQKFIVGDLLKEDDVVVMVTPIDESAPKGRIILPQQMVLREILDAGAIAVVTKETQLEKTLKTLSGDDIRLVITDSQVFDYVSKIVPKKTPLTSFSILMARYKGFLKTAVEGVKKLSSLNDGDTVLISEGCTHHRQCNDIGSVKIPKWLSEYTKKNLNLRFSSGGSFPEDLSGISLVIHCGGCMLPEREVLTRMNRSNGQNVAFTNYGTFIAFRGGILERSIEFFKNELK